MSRTDARPSSFALCNRAYLLLRERGTVDEDTLLAHVYGGRVAPQLRPKLLAPLVDDRRIERGEDGSWRLARTEQPTEYGAVPFTALAVVADGPRPGPAAVLAIAAQHVDDGRDVAELYVHLRPRRRVPHYAAARLGVEPDTLSDAPTFADVLDELIGFLADRPVVAQEADLAWRFLVAEAQRIARSLPDLDVLDLTVLGERILALPAKPALDNLLNEVGVNPVWSGSPRRESQAVARVAERLLPRASEADIDLARVTLERLRIPPLRDTATPRDLPDAPGVYVLAGEEGPLYVGKARRLRERLSAYVSRPLGPTRRLEGLSAAATRVDAELCDTDLEALILEERRIRELQPRFNTQRRLRGVRRWLRLPPEPPPRKSRTLAPRRLELREAPAADGEHLGPFRNEHLAAWARNLARGLFELDDARRQFGREAYRARLEAAWRFLQGERELGIESGQAVLAVATSRRDFEAARRWRKLLREAISFDVEDLVLSFDPLESRVALVRPAPGGGVEAFVVDRCVLVARASCSDDELEDLADRLSRDRRARTSPGDVQVVLRWLGAQRSPARLIQLPSDMQDAGAAVQEAACRVAADAATAAAENPRPAPES